jgi:hypothetical protein
VLAPIPRWSDGVAEGIGWLGVLGFFHDDLTALHRGLEGVPVEYHDNIAMLQCRLLQELMVRGDAHAAAAVVDAHRPTDRLDKLFTEFLQLVVDARRIRTGDINAELMAAVQHRAAAYVDDARRRRDGLTVCYAHLAHADILAASDSPAVALAAATEASSTGEAYGAGFIAAVGRRSMAEAVAAMAISGSGDRATAAREIRHVITEARDQHTMAMTFWALDPFAALLCDFDASAAYWSGWGRCTGGPAAVRCRPTPPTFSTRQLAPNWNSGQTRWMPPRSSPFALDAVERYLAAINSREADP